MGQTSTLPADGPRGFCSERNETQNWCGTEKEIKRKNETEDTIYKNRPGIRHVSTIRARSTRSVFIIFFFSLPLTSFHVSGLRRKRRNTKERSMEKTKKRKSLRRREMEAVRMRGTPTSIHGGLDPERASQLRASIVSLRRCDGKPRPPIPYPRHILTRAYTFFPSLPSLPSIHARLLRAIKARNRPSSSETTWP